MAELKKKEKNIPSLIDLNFIIIHISTDVAMDCCSDVGYIS